jgi:hypothetical protein
MITTASVFIVAFYTALVLASSLYALSLCGHFPLEHRATSLGDRFGTATLIATALLTICSVFAGGYAAFQQLSWYVIVLSTSSALLITPIVLSRFSDPFVNGRAALFAFSGTSLVFAISLHYLVAPF